MAPSANTFGPLKPADFHILMVLLDGDLHGYGIMQRVAEDSAGRVRLEVGSLYRLIARLTDEGVITDSDRKPEPGDNRRYYTLTSLGRQVARQEAQRLSDVVAIAKRHRLISDS